MDIKDITDKVFEVLDKNIYPAIKEKWHALNLEQESIAGTESNPHLSVEKSKLIRPERNKEIVRSIKPMLELELSAILPDAAFWFRDAEKPDAGLMWVVSVFEFDIMAPAMTSVALQKQDALLLGILGNFSQLEMIAGELGGGTWMESEEFKAGAKELSNTSSNMQFFLHKEKTSSTQLALLNAFRKKYNFQSQVNTVAQNISYYITLVARGTLDFTLGFNFSYPYIAAAVCIAEQAGGVVTDFSGGKAKLFTGEEFFCSNKITHRQFMNVANGFLNQESNDNAYNNRYRRN